MQVATELQKFGAEGSKEKQMRERLKLYRESYCQPIFSSVNIANTGYRK